MGLFDNLKNKTKSFIDDSKGFIKTKFDDIKEDIEEKVEDSKSFIKTKIDDIKEDIITSIDDRTKGVIVPTDIRRIRASTKLYYGNSYIVPLEYLKTDTKKSFQGEIPKYKSKKNLNEYKNFPNISKQLLKELFKETGLKYVPEVAIFELEKYTPYESFERFCISFNRNKTREINSNSLNNTTILSLISMDSLRNKYKVYINTKPIYNSLFNSPSLNEKLFNDFKDTLKTIEKSEKLNLKEEEFLKDKEELFQYWDKFGVLYRFQQKYQIKI